MCIVYCNSGHKYSNSTDEYIPYQYFDHICPVLDNIYISVLPRSLLSLTVDKQRTRVKEKENT